jgi:hypothetical protein
MGSDKTFLPTEEKDKTFSFFFLVTQWQTLSCLILF